MKNFEKTKVVILAGGLGTRLSEETESRPKPMVEIGGMPILWHIMKIYSAYGFNDFVICLGYKGYLIKEYFSNYFLHTSDVTFDMQTGERKVHLHRSEPWKVTLVDTGAQSMTGGRLLRVKPYLEGCGSFMLTYGDGVSNVDVRALFEFHKKQGREGTVTAVYPPGRFGSLEISEDNKGVNKFTEKPAGDGGRINGGFFVFEEKFIHRIAGDASILEQEPLKGLASEGGLSAFEHDGFWQPMDTIRDKIHLEGLWQSGKAPWKTW